MYQGLRKSGLKARSVTRSESGVAKMMGNTLHNDQRGAVPVYSLLKKEMQRSKKTEARKEAKA